MSHASAARATTSQTRSTTATRPDRAKRIDALLDFVDTARVARKYKAGWLCAVPKRQVKELTARAAQDFDAFYADRLCEPG